MATLLVHKTTGMPVYAADGTEEQMMRLTGYRTPTDAEAKELGGVAAGPGSATDTADTAGDTSSGAAGGPPPKTGPGSGRGAWAEYAAAHGVTVADSASREEIVAACEAASVPTE